MNKESFVIKEFDLKLTKPENAKFISYSQYSTFKKCPKQWELKYIHKLKDSVPSIHMTFGTSMHNVVQYWLQILFSGRGGVKASNELNFEKLLLDELKLNYASDVEKYGKHFSNKEELTEFFLDGLETLEFLRKRRTRYFDLKNQILVGTELPLMIKPNPDKENLYFNAYLDIVLKHKTEPKFYIPDLKTSTKGWNQWDKKDEVKIGQLLLYKKFLSEQYGIPIDDIEVEFMILKRKIDSDSMYPQKRVQIFSPSQGKISMSKALKSFQEFIDYCFLPNGEYNELAKYVAISGRNGFNCRYCEFNNKEDLCPKSKRE